MYKKYNDIITGLVLMVVCGVLWAEAGHIVNLSYMPIKADGLPKITIAAIFILALVIFLQGLYKLAKTPKESSRSGEGKLVLEKALAVGFCLLTILLAIIALKPLGFLPTMVLYLFCNFAVLTPKEKRNWPIICLTAILAPIAVWAMFVLVFEITLPYGVLSFMEYWF